MLALPASVRIYLAVHPVDLRRGIDGLAALVRAQGHDVFSGHLFAFVGRDNDRIKILTWDRGGFVVYYKRLELGRFRLPSIPAGSTQVELEATQLAMLLDGLDVRRVTPAKRWTPPATQKLDAIP